MWKYAALLSTVALTGCGTTDLVTKQTVVVMPPASLFNCPGSKYLPDPKQLTDLQVARFIEMQYSANQQCKNSLNAVKSYLRRAQKITASAAK